MPNFMETKQNTYYSLNPHISKNIYDKSWQTLFAKIRENARFKRSKKTIPEYVTELLATNKLSQDKLKEFLFNQILYGIHKDLFLYRFDDDKSYTNEDIINILKENFNISDLNYNELDIIVDLENKLGAVKVETNKETARVEKVILIIVKKVNYTKKELKRDYGKNKMMDIEYYENSYFPVEIDFKEKMLIVKSSPKSHINKTQYKGLNLSAGVVKDMKKCFGLNFTSFQDKYQRALHTICSKLLEEVIKEKCRNSIGQFSTLIDNTVIEFTNEFDALGINLETLKNTIKSKNVFDIRGNILNMIENVVISKILGEALKNKEGVEGIASYIKFKDKTASKTVIKTLHRKQTLLDSQSYLDLRKTLNESKFVERVRIVWFNKKEELQLSYDCRKMMYMHIHFYEKFFKKEQEYAIERIKQFED